MAAHVVRIYSTIQLKINLFYKLNSTGHDWEQSFSQTPRNIRMATLSTLF